MTFSSLATASFISNHGKSVLLPSLVSSPKLATSVAKQFLPSDTTTNTLHTLLTLRGGEGGGTQLGAGAAALANFSGQAAGFFSNVRVPASLIAGSSLGALFAMSKDARDMDNKSPVEQVLLRLYHVILTISWILSMTTIVFSTAAGVTFMYGDFDPMATSAYELLLREFHFEYISARFSFLTSIVLFFVAVCNRVILEFGLYTKEKKNLGLAAAFVVLASTTHITSFINSTLYSYPNLFMMGLEVVKVSMILRVLYVMKMK